MEKINHIKISDKELVDLIKEMPRVSKKNGWIFTFDKDEDALFYSPAIVPSDVELYQVKDEFAVYVDKKKRLQGVMSEYFKNNFVKHHDGFKLLVNKVFNKEGENEIEDVDPNKGKDDDVKIFKVLFENTLIAEACGAVLHS